MTEQEWLTSNGPQAMLEHLRYSSHEELGGVVTQSRHPGPSDRKLRLFACACCRQVWDGAECMHCKGLGTIGKQGIINFVDCLWCHGTGRTGGLTDERSRNAVEVVERYADGLTEGISDACVKAYQAWSESGFENVPMFLAWASATSRSVFTEGPDTDRFITRWGLVAPSSTQANLLRDIFGNPFLPVVVTCRYPDLVDEYGGRARVIDWTPEWKQWRTPTVLAVAQVIYEERRFTDMPILADALEDAGCEDWWLLSHCRGEEMCPVCLSGPNRKQCRTMPGGNPDCFEGNIPKRGPCVRGCWVLDLILGKS